VEEEQVPGYDAKSFLAVNPGDVFSNRYEATAELGSGGFSTVWPAKDLHWYVSDLPSASFISDSFPGGYGNQIDT
jgi:hypothetical protein